MPFAGFLSRGERRFRGSDPALLHDGRVQIPKTIEQLLSSGLFGRRALGNAGEIGNCLEGGLARHRAVVRHGRRAVAFLDLRPMGLPKVLHLR